MHMRRARRGVRLRRGCPAVWAGKGRRGSAEPIARPRLAQLSIDLVISLASPRRPPTRADSAAYRASAAELQVEPVGLRLEMLCSERTARSAPVGEAIPSCTAVEEGGQVW